MGYDIFRYLGISLGLTLVLELIFALVLRIRTKKDLLLVCLVNIITNPVVVWLYILVAQTTSWNQYIVLSILELLAFTAEALLYKSYGDRIRRPFLFSAGANVFSFFVGELIEILFS